MWIRTPAAAELPLLVAIERAADATFAPLGIVFPPGGTVIEGVVDPADVLVAGDPPIAFAYTRRLDSHLHLHQIAVAPESTRRGIGSLLLTSVVERAGELGVTLTT